MLTFIVLLMGSFSEIARILFYNLHILEYLLLTTFISARKKHKAPQPEGKKGICSQAV